jgi:hypothetical protein
MMLWLVVIQDKELPGELDVGIGFCDSEQAAQTLADSMLAQLVAVGRGRCVARFRAASTGEGYRASSLMRTCAAPDDRVTG